MTEGFDLHFSVADYIEASTREDFTEVIRIGRCCGNALLVLAARSVLVTWKCARRPRLREVKVAGWAFFGARVLLAGRLRTGRLVREPSLPPMEFGLPPGMADCSVRVVGLSGVARVLRGEVLS